MGARREIEGAGQQLPVGVGLVRLDLGEQLLDEVLMPLQDCHGPSVPLAVFRAAIRSPAANLVGEEGFTVRPVNPRSPC